MSAHCITALYYSPNRWGESYRTAAPLKLIVGDQAECYGDVPSTVSQPPEILNLTKASMLRAIALTCICCSALI